MAEDTESAIDAETPRTSFTIPTSTSSFDRSYGHTSLPLGAGSPAFETPTSATVSLTDDIPIGETQTQYIQTSTSAYESPANIVDEQLRVGGTDADKSTTTTQSSLNNGEPLSSGISTRDAADLLSLRYMPQHRATPTSVPTDPSQIYASVPRDFDSKEPLFGHDFNAHDGIFLPGSVYREFHSALRDHLIYTAKSNAPTRHGSPDLPEFGVGIKLSSRLDELGRWDSESDSQLSKIAEITPQREYILWKSWIDELAPWVSGFSTYLFSSVVSANLHPA